MIRFLALFCVIGIAPQLNAQQPNQAWNFESVESADLLFHGLAVVGVRGFSSLPLYDLEYAEQVRAAKEAKGIYPTSLDKQAGSFREAFESDSTFELLHFLPLYFGPVSTTTVIDVLTEVAGGGGARPAGTGGAGRFPCRGVARLCRPLGPGPGHPHAAASETVRRGREGG